MPQGTIPIDPTPTQDDLEPDYPPLLQQVRNSMLKFPHCVLLTRVGGFYEVGRGLVQLAKANTPSCTSNMQTSSPLF
jgi:hypothetical protein